MNKNINKWIDRKEKRRERERAYSKELSDNITS